MGIRKFLALISVVLMFSNAGVFADQPAPGTYAKDVKERTLILPRCARPIGTIVADQFTCKAADCSLWNSWYGISPIGSGMSDMLVTALQQSGCFTVYEREDLAEVQQELALEGIRPQLKAADFILTGAVTAFEYNEESSGGGGGISIPLPIFGDVHVKTGDSQAHIGLDLRIIRVRDAQILVSKSIEGKAGRSNFSAGGDFYFGNSAVWGNLHSRKNTPIEEAVRDVLSQGIVSIMNELTARGFASTPQPVPAYSEPGNNSPNASYNYTGK